MHRITNEIINPEIRTRGKIIRKLLPYFKVTTFGRCNRYLKFIKSKASKKLKFEEVYIKREDGTKLRVCIYSPLEDKKDAPGILWIHGGGYGLGIPEQDEGFIKEFVLQQQCVVVSPDYTLSVEKPYPAALHDCYRTLVWMRDYAKQYGIRNDQLMIGGDSAGGGLTAALAIYARDKGEVSIAFQMPIYPMLDDRMITESSRDNDAPVWNTKSNENAWKLYLKELYKTEDVPVYAAPGRLTNFENLPPAFTYVGAIEPFKDETVTFMEGLKKAGIPAEYKIFEGCYHAFDIIAPKSTPAIAARKLLKENLDYAVKHYFNEQPK